MIDITSKNNQVYKLFQKLQTKKYRDKLGLYLIEGENLIEEALSEGAEIEKAVVRKSGEKRLGSLIERLRVNQSQAHTPQAEPAAAADAAEKLFAADESIFKSMAQTETSQGIIAAVRKPVASPEAFLSKKTAGNYVVLDRLQDPGNIGTIIRTADAAGYELVVAIKGTADVFSPKSVRAAAGSLFRIPIVFMETEEELRRFIKAAGKTLVAASPIGSRYYFEEDLSRNIALIVGNEGNGVSESLIKAAELKIRIPMEGTIESLNASVAAAIIMYETVRAGHTATSI